LALLACGLANPAGARAELEGIHKIQHVVVIMQENRTFDTYFGTYPGANGIPHGVCVPDPEHGGCVRPFFDPEGRNAGGPHGTGSSIEDINEGKMDGFVRLAESALGCTETGGCGKFQGIPLAGIDVMGYHDARQIANYWKYAEEFVLQDAMFEPVASWSLPEHLEFVSGWSAI